MKYKKSLKKFLSSIFQKFRNLKKKLKGKKRRIFVSFLLIWSLKVSQVKAGIIPGADGFSPPDPIHRNHCINNQNPIDDRILNIKGVTIIMEDPQVISKYKHAHQFGVMGKRSRPNFELYKEMMIEHMENPLTVVIDGTYKKHILVYHFYNPYTSLNVMIKKDGNTFLSAWKLTEVQENYMNNGGDLK